jgi:hypothetical protein
MVDGSVVEEEEEQELEPHGPLHGLFGYLSFLRISNGFIPVRGEIDGNDLAQLLDHFVVLFLGDIVLQELLAVGVA